MEGSEKPAAPRDYFWRRHLWWPRSARVLFAFPVLAGLVLWGWTAGNTKATESDEPDALPVATLQVKQQASLETRALYAGTVVANRASELGFERSGRLHRVLVREGTLVTAGQVLAELDASELQAQQNQLNSQLAQARAILRELEAGTRPEVVANARAQVAEAEEQLRLLALQHERRQELMRREAISREEMETFTAQLATQAARLDAVRHRLHELEAGARSEQLDAQRAAVAVAMARLEEVEILIGKSRLRAPFAGSIARRLLDEGAFVGPGTPVLALLESGELEVRVGIPVDQLHALRNAERHLVLVQGKRAEASLRRILPQLDSSTRVLPVLLSLPDLLQGVALPGMLAQLELPRVLLEPGFAVPVSALTRADRGLWACYAVVPVGGDTLLGQLERREVEILHSDGEQAYVRGFLQDGERIVASGVSRVTDRQRVLVMEDN